MLDLTNVGSPPAEKGNWKRVTGFASYVTKDVNRRGYIVLYDLEGDSGKRIDDMPYDQIAALNSMISIGKGLFYDIDADHFSIGG